MKINIKNNGSTIKVALSNEGKPVSFKEFLRLCSSHPKFPEQFLDVFNKIPYSSYRWEHPKLDSNNLSNPYESIFIDSPLSDSPEIEAFREHYSEDLVVSFPNLSGDCILIVPTPVENSNYSHLKNFIENSPLEQKIEFLKTLGRSVQETLKTRHVWLNTAGAGVAWLHLRLDSRPKYYQHQPYVNAG